MAAFNSFLTLGPGLFMLVHMQAILCVLALVGELENPNIIQIIQTSINPLDMNLIPDKWIPKIHFSGFEFDPIFNNDLISNSGYRIQTSIFNIGFSLTVFLIQITIMALMFLLLSILVKFVCPWWARGEKIKNAFIDFIAISFTYRFFLEYFLKLFLTIVLEMSSMIQDGRRHLDYSLKYKIALGISVLIFVIMVILLLLVILKVIRKISTNPKDSVVTSGLN